MESNREDTGAVSPERRKEILDGEVSRYESRGYHVEDRAGFRVTMMRPKKFSFIWRFCGSCSSG